MRNELNSITLSEIDGISLLSFTSGGNLDNMQVIRLAVIITAKT